MAEKNEAAESLEIGVQSYRDTIKHLERTMDRETNRHETADGCVVYAPPAPRYADVSCSQCGGDFGPGDHGFSHCSDHLLAEAAPWR